MGYNEAETRFFLIDPILRQKGDNEYWKLRLETPAPVEPIGPRGRRRAGAGCVDYLLCVQVGDMPKPLPVAVIEAKAETEDPLKGMRQAKGYSDCARYFPYDWRRCMLKTKKVTLWHLSRPDFQQRRLQTFSFDYYCASG